MTSKPVVLILCTGNSCRSHMAEGILRAAAGDLIEVQSAGSIPAGYVHPLAIRALGEIGIDLAGHTSKHLNTFLDRRIDTVITVCGKADQVCPVFPGQVNRYHWGFGDPAHAEGTEEEVLAVSGGFVTRSAWYSRRMQPGCGRPAPASDLDLPHRPSAAAPRESQYAWRSAPSRLGVMTSRPCTPGAGSDPIPGK